MPGLFLISVVNAAPHSKHRPPSVAPWGLGYELQHAFKGVIENKASMHNVHLRVGYTF